MVKNIIMKARNVEGKIEQDSLGKVQNSFKLVNNKVIVPAEDEIQKIRVQEVRN